MALVTTTAATDTPVTLAEAKAQCRILSSDTTHDTLLARLIVEAQRSIETYTGARLATETVQLSCDGFPAGYGIAAKLDLGLYPVASITSVKYDDSDGDEQTLVLDTDYYENLGGMYPYISPVTYWPATKAYKPACVRVVMVAGYAMSGSPEVSTCPEDLKHAVLMRVKEYFDNSGESVTGQSVEATVNTVKALTDMHRRLPV